ncbi:pectinesterase inhibitor 10-like [Phragmites australis]|uniref:pectinesterase inhibitor 10-like n=1 Tax=Phragmites australis TaxID=29695 RepID=UPI002D770CAF|nr:pectinesterase inhibitor 10-like [Phragmites australis]
MASTATFLFILAAAVSMTSDAAASSFRSSPVAPPPCTAPPSTVAFLRARCATTLHRVTCYDSLIPYGCVFQNSHVKLARAAADVNASQLRVLSKHLKELVARGGGPGVESAALRDCASTVSSAAGLAKDSAAELAKLDAAGAAARKSQVRWAISNAQTWLSAAMSNEATCADGLGTAGPATSPVSGEVVSAKEHTNIALALVNGIPLPSQ